MSQSHAHVNKVLIASSKELLSYWRARAICLLLLSDELLLELQLSATSPLQEETGWGKNWKVIVIRNAELRGIHGGKIGLESNRVQTARVLSWKWRL